MTTVNDIEDRLTAVAFSGRSYHGASREENAAAHNAAVTDFEANAAVGIAYLIGRVRKLQTAIITAVAKLSDAASDIAEEYAADDEEATAIRVIIGGPVDALVAIVQGAEAQTEEATK